jgi:phosphoribosylanthranilate isomerase
VAKVKICGITNLDDARLAVSEGAWAIGLIFAPESVRRCDLDAAEEIGAAVKRKVEVAGVFANAHLDELAEIAERCSLTLLQLHGEEGPAYCDEAARRTGCKIIKAVRAKDAATVRSLRSYRVDFHMLDAHVPGRRGGTGETFPWELAAERGDGAPLILSGGITPENAADAVAAVHPFAVDSASGTEASPGRKDPAKVRALVRAVAQASAAAAA